MTVEQMQERPRRAYEEPDQVEPAVERDRARRATRRGRSKLWWLSALLLAVLSGSVTYAMWSTQTTLAGAEIHSGEFDFTLGNMTWTSPTLKQSGNDPSSLSNVSVGDGDVLVFTQNLSGTFEGDNLRVRFEIVWPGLPDGAVTTWHVNDGDGNQVAPASGDAPGSEPLSPDDIVNNGLSHWQIVVTVLMPSAGSSVYESPHDSPPVTQVTLGPLQITADQYRG